MPFWAGRNLLSGQLQMGFRPFFYALLLLTVFRAESSFNTHKSQRGENLKKMDRGRRCQFPGGMVRAMSNAPLQLTPPPPQPHEALKVALVSWGSHLRKLYRPVPPQEILDCQNFWLAFSCLKDNWREEISQEKREKRKEDETGKDKRPHRSCKQAQ